ncbi:prohibitin family protein [Candidatus Altiarchaeota archaeon]
MKIFGEEVEIPVNVPKGSGKQAGGAGALIALMVFGFIALTIISPLLIASVGAGERGVKFNYLSGGVLEDEFVEGWHIKPPWVSVINYNIRTQGYTMSIMAGEGQVAGDDRITAISKDGLNVDFDVTILYHIIPENADDIHSTVGKKYEDVIIRPISRTNIRDIAGGYLAMDMHQKRPEIAEKIFTKLEPLFNDKNIVLEQVLVRSIVRPPQIERAIEVKLEAEQDAQKMEFVIQKESKEAERKRIEAEGISKANQIIGSSLTPSYLSWYWITNLDKHNSVIYVPINDQGFPMFKNIDNIDTSVVDSP